MTTALQEHVRILQYTQQWTKYFQELVWHKYFKAIHLACLVEIKTCGRIT